MGRLTQQTLSQLPDDVQVPQYDHHAVSCGIVHFGAGNFHRAHQALYCEKLLNLGETQWGITGVSLRSAGMRDKLAPQDCLYTQVTLGEKTAYQVVGAIQSLLVAPENPQAVIDAVAKPQTQLVSMTITEKAYGLLDGQLDTNHADFASDLTSLAAPKTIYGYLAAALIQRSEQQDAKLTILCCDNMNAGGEHLENGVMTLLSQHKPEIKEWTNNNVSFIASMVDRVTPATTDELLGRVAEKLGVEDASPVAAEPFTQWVIEDNFAGEKPRFDKVGAIFVDSIAPFERVKLRFLNASHSMLAAMGYLAGDDYIHQAIQRPQLEQFADNALRLNVLPATDVPQGINGQEYIEQVFARFRNANLPYASLQVGTDSSLKIQQRWIPSLEDALAKQLDTQYLAFALAAWAVFIRKAAQAGDLNDPLKDQFTALLNQDTSKDLDSFLQLAGAKQSRYFSDEGFMAQVRKNHVLISEKGILQVLGDS